MGEKNCDGCEDRRKDKWKVWKELFIGVAVIVIGAYILSISSGIGDIKEKTSMMTVDISWLKTIQSNQTQALIGVNTKMDDMSIKMQTMKIALDEHMHRVSVVDRCVKRIAENNILDPLGFFPIDDPHFLLSSVVEYHFNHLRLISEISTRLYLRFRTRRDALNFSLLMGLMKNNFSFS